MALTAAWAAAMLACAAGCSSPDAPVTPSPAPSPLQPAPQVTRPQPPAPTPLPTPQATQPQPTVSAARTDPTAGLVLSGQAASCPVPDFLTSEQQELYRKARFVYSLTFSGDTTAIGSYTAAGGAAQTAGSVEIDGDRYLLAGGDYRRWEDFDGLIHALFTDSFWARRNTRSSSHPIYREVDGHLAIMELSMDDGMRSDRFPDTFRLVEQGKDTVAFTVTGYYADVWPREGESYEERDERLESGDYDYELEFPVTLVRTSAGWRVDELRNTYAPTDENSALMGYLGAWTVNGREVDDLSPRRAADALCAAASVRFTLFPVSGPEAQVTLTPFVSPADGTTVLDGGNTLKTLVTYYRWARLDGAPEDPPTGASVELSAGDAALRVWEDSTLLSVRQGEREVWFRAQHGGEDGAYRLLRNWFDDEELEALQPTVIPDRGQEGLAAAQEWADAWCSAFLRLSPGSRYGCTYARAAAVELDPDYASPSAPPGSCYFAYQMIFVPASPPTADGIPTSALFAGNTDFYSGSDAPEGACCFYRIGLIHPSGEGWYGVCLGTG